jgi:hypothetical protein
MKKIMEESPLDETEELDTTLTPVFVTVTGTTIGRPATRLLTIQLLNANLSEVGFLTPLLLPKSP